MKKMTRLGIAVALVMGGAIGAAAPASAAEAAPTMAQAPASVQTVGPVCSGGDIQHEWDPFPIQYWVWGRVSGNQFYGERYTYYGPDVGWVQADGMYTYCH